MQNNGNQFLAALEKFGMNVTSDMKIPDGKIQRAHIFGDKSGSKNGWYVFHGDFGKYGNWKTGIIESWKASKFTNVIHANFHNQKDNTAALQALAKELANKIWESSQAEDGTNPYLVTKGVKSYGLMRNDTSLIIPICDENSEIHSLQFIKPNGDKRFLKNGRKKSCFFVLGSLQGNIVCIAEGYATAASIHQATSYPVVVAFDSGNLLPVGEVMRRKLPKVKLIYCADNDAEAEVNTGLIKAQEAADKTSGIVVTPTESES